MKDEFVAMVGILNAKIQEQEEKVLASVHPGMRQN